ncbi:hypothetical protein [Butyrivibrio sp. AC2005]|uniref:hypothetical protein n=1 Tax=Butyrivibrio sp. AC2005 TaxID=1280672 RepID=UPI0003FE71F7|nr:hypothetical protein [Butyrivibrio sp. AC2005]
MRYTKKLFSITLCAAFLLMSFTCKANASALDESINAIEEETTNNYSIDPNNFTVDDLNKYTEEVITRNSSGGNTRFRAYDDCVVVDLWADGISDYAEIAKTNAEYKQVWDQTVEGMRDMSEALYEQYSKFDMEVFVYVLNEKNTDNVLIMCQDGVAIYDCVNGDPETNDVIDMTRYRFR